MYIYTHVPVPLESRILDYMLDYYSILLLYSTTYYTTPTTLHNVVQLYYLQYTIQLYHNVVQLYYNYNYRHRIYIR